VKAFSITLALEIGLLSLVSVEGHSSTNNLKASPKAKVTTTEPVIALWDDGSTLSHSEPFLLFAAWEDGTVVRKPESLREKWGGTDYFNWAKKNLLIGSVPPSVIVDLQRAIAKAGFFQPPLECGALFPDGPCETLFVQHGKARRLMSHYGVSDKILREYVASIGPHANPSRDDGETLIAMWDKIAELIDRISPKMMIEFQSQRKLIHPKSFEATDENGDPSIAYWGIPEHKEEKAFAGTPRCLTTITTIQVIPQERYQALKREGILRKEERHGNWIYFSTDDVVDIPNDTGSTGRITRYKSQLPTR
jgi:hypothetical protein